MIISISIDVNKILKDYIVQGEKGRYLSLSIKDGIASDYGSDFMVFQDIGKDARMSGLKGPVVGHGKFMSREPFKPKEKGAPVPVIAGTDPF